MAAEFGVDKKSVNSLLYGKLNGQVWQYKEYRWYPKDHAHSQGNSKSTNYTNNWLEEAD
jgi:hypothetical protein